MASRVTIQDIADALGVSRNTVSKALNNTGILADATRERVISKAIEMGYKQFSFMAPPHSRLEENTLLRNGQCEIALLTLSFLGSSHFSSTMLDKFQREISQLGYTFTMYRVLPEERKSLSLPPAFNRKKTAGIICLEMFDPEYSKMICNLDIPVLFVDSPAAGLLDAPLKSDLLYMENYSSVAAFLKEMVRRGKTRIGFIGEYRHCQSFFERYMSYRNALYLLGLPCPEEYCILGNKEVVEAPSSADYREYLHEKISQLNTLPDVFLCANDFVAIDVMQIFKDLRISVPDDIWLCGFDDSPESRVVTPPLTTIHIHCEIMGISAAQLLLSRIKEPSLNFRTIHTETNVIYRESTGDVPTAK
jgi:LacI family transcriptional regulator